MSVGSTSLINFVPTLYQRLMHDPVCTLHVAPCPKWDITIGRNTGMEGLATEVSSAIDSWRPSHQAPSCRIVTRLGVAVRKETGFDAE